MATLARVASCIDQCRDGRSTPQSPLAKNKRKRPNRSEVVSLSSIPEWKDEPSKEDALFVALPHWFIRERVRTLGTDAAWVYGYLLSRRNKKGYAWPSVATIAKELGIGTTCTKKCLRKLEAERLIKGRQNPGTSTSYFVQLPPQRQSSLARRLASTTSTPRVY